ncbi:hypothetical protein [Hufsiella ginkgonis]|uniref:DUF2116 family Zn-ribbon domain-containing protein n=1 Tax=Hufsiella ginkgonis TaxID=2695274 RepID=A0A7K1XYZ4_9SPHI|nr:hypothetical protein [Hufsiella ginkgonis]MXV16162.1 hypothetical protein [Hufsiella ginkgonis]
MMYCHECGTLLKGRADKKFCDEHCRNAFNNRKNKTITNFVRRVDAHLKKNRIVLESLRGETDRLVHRSELLQRGFEPGYYTHICDLQNGQPCFFCYEYGFRQVNDREVLLLAEPVETYRPG